MLTRAHAPKRGLTRQPAAPVVIGEAVEFPVHSAVTWPTDARQVVQGEHLTAGVDRLHVVNVEPVTRNVATGTTPPVASPRCAARTPPLACIVGPIREARAAKQGGGVIVVLAHQRGFHGCSPMETVVTSLTLSMMHR